MRKCPNCKHKMYWNYWKKRFECLKTRGGCGYIPNSRQTKLTNQTTLV